MIRICDYIFNKDEIICFKKINYHIADKYSIEVCLKNKEEIEIFFDGMYERDTAFAEIIKGDEDE